MMSLTCIVLTFLAVNFYKMLGGTMGSFNLSLTVLTVVPVHTYC